MTLGTTRPRPLHADAVEIHLDFAVPGREFRLIFAWSLTAQAIDSGRSILLYTVRRWGEGPNAPVTLDACLDQPPLEITVALIGGRIFDGRQRYSRDAAARWNAAYAAAATHAERRHSLAPAVSP